MPVVPAARVRSVSACVGVGFAGVGADPLAAIGDETVGVVWVAGAAGDALEPP